MSDSSCRLRKSHCFAVEKHRCEMEKKNDIYTWRVPREVLVCWQRAERPWSILRSTSSSSWRTKTVSNFDPFPRNAQTSSAKKSSAAHASAHAALIDDRWSGNFTMLSYQPPPFTTLLICFKLFSGVRLLMYSVKIALFADTRIH